MTDSEFYRSIGICTRCHKRLSMVGKASCEYCAEKFLERYYSERDENREKRRVRDKKRYERLKAAGLCTICGSKPAYKGGVRCYEHYIAQKKRDKGRGKDYAGLAVCLDCGIERMDGEKYCAECLEKRRGLAEYARGFVNRENHVWRIQDRNYLKEMAWED